MIDMTDVVKRYTLGGETIYALNHISLHVDKGEYVAIIGPSGSGKSTLMNIIGCLDTADSGSYMLNDKPIQKYRERQLARIRNRQIGFIFQGFNLLPKLSALENVELPLIYQGVGVSQRRAAAREALERVGLGQRMKHRPAQLSGGQQQRCALARILASAPRAILLDEPFSALDGYLQDQLEVELAQTLEQFSGPVVWVSHDRGEVFRNCPQVCVMDRGTSQPVTSLEALFRSPGTEAAARLSGCQTCVRAVADRDNVFLPEWGLTLFCGCSVPLETRSVGIRAQHVRPAAPGEKNAFICVVVRQIRDEAADMVLLRPEGSTPQAPLLRMELSDRRQITENRITVAVAPEDLLLLC